MLPDEVTETERNKAEDRKELSKQKKMLGLISCCRIKSVKQRGINPKIGKN